MTDETGLTPEQIEAIKSFGDDTEALRRAAKDEASPLHVLFNWDNDTEEGQQSRAENLVTAANAQPTESPAGGEDDEAASAAEGDPAPAGGEPAADAPAGDDAGGTA